MCSSSLGGLTTALASRRLRGEGSMPARDLRAFTMEAWLLVFMEKMGCPAARGRHDQRVISPLQPVACGQDCVCVLHSKGNLSTIFPMGRTSGCMQTL